jgi:hypothetical protein
MGKVAVLIRDNLPGYRGKAAVYKLSNPLDGHEFVVVSSVYLEFPDSVKHIVPNYYESFVFPSDPEGNVVDWGKLDGSITRSEVPIPHEECFKKAGYQLAYQ